MLTLASISSAIRSVITTWINDSSDAQIRSALEAPRHSGPIFARLVCAQLQTSTELVADVFRSGAPYIHLSNVFDTDELNKTPEGFYPVPDSKCTFTARASTIAATAIAGMETVSYRSENDGELFVNLVVIPGAGIISEKSQKDMKGHTDAVSFPFKVQKNIDEARSISPSPDYVCLTGLRNPNNVPTTVLPLNIILEKLSTDVIQELKKPQFVIRSQTTFIPGMKKILGGEVIIDGGAILEDFGNETWVRFSHSNVMFDGPDDETENTALIKFKEACRSSFQDVVVAPGDIVLINNHLALHGRGVVGPTHGDRSRWLLRSYSLNTHGIDEKNRYGSSSVLFP